jgi:hypothetical protein
MSGLPSFNLAATIEKIAGPVSNGYAARLRTDSLNEVVIAVMVEKRECVEDLDAILAVEGLEMVQFGASDFSMSLGRTGQHNHRRGCSHPTRLVAGQRRGHAGDGARRARPDMLHVGRQADRGATRQRGVLDVYICTSQDLI